MKETKLPDAYEPYEILLICGNTFRNGLVPISVDGRPVFLLGKGKQTNVWLQVPTGKQWRYEITPDHIDDSAFVVARSENVTSVYFGVHHILRAEQVDDIRVKIDHLDFRPFGLAIHGDPTTLYIGTNKLVANSFNNVKTMVNVK